MSELYTKEDAIQSLIDALEFYAEGGHYSEGHTGCAAALGSTYHTIIDKGEVATKTLERWYEFLRLEYPGGIRI